MSGDEQMLSRRNSTDKDPKDEWQKITLKAENFEKSSSFGDFVKTKATNVFMKTDFKELEIDAEVIKVKIVRPWLNRLIFNNSMIGVPSRSKYSVS